MTFDELGRAMQAMREGAGLTRMALVRKSGLAPMTVRLLEQGKLDCRWSTLVMYAKACGVRLEVGHDFVPTDGGVDVGSED